MTSDRADDRRLEAGAPPTSVGRRRFGVVHGEHAASPSARRLPRRAAVAVVALVAAASLLGSEVVTVRADATVSARAGAAATTATTVPPIATAASPDAFPVGPGAGSFVVGPLAIPDVTAAVMPRYRALDAPRVTLFAEAQHLRDFTDALDGEIAGEQADLRRAQADVVGARGRVRALAAAGYTSGRIPSGLALDTADFIEAARRVRLSSMALDAQQTRLERASTAAARLTTDLGAHRGERAAAGARLGQVTASLRWLVTADSWMRTGTAPDPDAAALPGSSLTVEQFDAALRAARRAESQGCRIPWSLVAASLAPVDASVPSVPGVWIGPAESVAGALCAAHVSDVAGLRAFVAATGVNAATQDAVVTRATTLAALGPPALPRNRVLIIGDSLTEGAQFVGLEQELRAAGWDPVVDAKRGRSSTAGLPVLDDHLDESWAVVVVALGTNDGADPVGYAARLTRYLDLLPDTRVVVFPPTWTPVAPLAAAASELAEQRPQLHVGRWADVLAFHFDWVGPDGVHLTADGYRAYRDAIVDAVGR